MKVFPHSGPEGPTPRRRLLRAGATVAATLVLGLTAGTAVALADDTAPGHRDDPGRPVAATVVDWPATTITAKPPPTTEPPTTIAPHPGICGGDHGDDDCRPPDPVEPEPPTTATTTEAPTTTTTEAPTTTTTEAPSATTAPPTSTPPTSTANGGVAVISPGAQDATGTGGGASPVAAATTDGGGSLNGTAGSAPPAPSRTDDAAPTPGSGESALASFGQTELAEAGTVTPGGSFDPAPPFSTRLWVALPLGLLIGLVLVGVALGAVRIARLGTTP